MERGRTEGSTGPYIAVGLVLVTVLAIVALAGFITDGSVTTRLARPASFRPDDGAAPTTPTALPTNSTSPSTTTSPPPTAAPLDIAPAVSRVPTQDHVIFLGIDDGLTRDPAVLDFLDAHDIPFSAFIVEGPLEADPEYWARARAVGGTIEAHTLTHPNLTKLSADQIRSEVCGSADAIEAATGRRPTLFRPPYGLYDDTVRTIAAQCGFSAVALWKGSTNDGRVDFQEGAMQPGDILLMHWRPDLLQNLKNVLALVKAQGYTIGRLEDYVGPLP